jgi:hypothetical protein
MPPTTQMVFSAYQLNGNSLKTASPAEVAFSTKEQKRNALAIERIDSLNDNVISLGAKMDVVAANVERIKNEFNAMKKERDTLQKENIQKDIWIHIFQNEIMGL